MERGARLEALVDTNILVYEMVEDSMHHEEVVSRLGKLERVYILTNILIEFILVLKKLGVNDKTIMDKVNEILNCKEMKLLPLKISNFKEAIRIINEEKGSLKRINDKLILSVAKENNTPLYTYDKQLAKQARKQKIKIIK